MKIFVVTSAIPCRQHGHEKVTAVHIVLYSLITSLQQEGHEIVLQPIFNAFRDREEITREEAAELAHLEENGIRTLSAFSVPAGISDNGVSSRVGLVVRAIEKVFVGRRMEEFYPAVSLRQAVAERIRQSGAKVVLTLWSPEGIAATHGLRDALRISYQGDIDFMPVAARMKDCFLFSDGQSGRNVIRTMRGSLARAYQQIRLRQFREIHWNLMREVDVIANVTAFNAEFYRRLGHSRSIYSRNTWLDPGRERALRTIEERTHETGTGPIKIIGHVGHLARTGSTYGLKYLLVDLMPHLEKAMEGLDYAVHVIGGGEVVPGLRTWSRHPRIVMRGFVEDLDSELASGDAFVLLNNAGYYRAAYTRHILAWSMGLCLVVHSNSLEAIPEIFPGGNALAGSTPGELAHAIRLAVTDRGLNQRIRTAGRETYERFFTPQVVAQGLSEAIARVAA